MVEKKERIIKETKKYKKEAEDELLELQPRIEKYSKEVGLAQQESDKANEQWRRANTLASMSYLAKGKKYTYQVLQSHLELLKEAKSIFKQVIELYEREPQAEVSISELESFHTKVTKLMGQAWSAECIEYREIDLFKKSFESFLTSKDQISERLQGLAAEREKLSMKLGEAKQVAVITENEWKKSSPSLFSSTPEIIKKTRAAAWECAKLDVKEWQKKLAALDGGIALVKQAEAICNRSLQLHVEDKAAEAIILGKEMEKLQQEAKEKLETKSNCTIS